MGKPANNQTDAELDRMIAERYATMPIEPPQGRRRKVTRADITAVLAGKRMTAKQIAVELRTTTRAIQQIVCSGLRWLSRVKPEGCREYAYFLGGSQWSCADSSHAATDAA